MSTATKPHISLRWFQFRLRTLLVAMLVLGCGLGWWKQRYRAAREAWKPILAIERVPINGVTLEFENDVRSQSSWIEQKLHIDMPNKVMRVWANFGEKDEASANKLRMFSNLRSLSVDFLIFSDEQFLSIIKNNPKLEKLSVCNRTDAIQGKGWENLSLPHIQSLYLYVGFPLPDEAMVRLSQSQTLKHLRLHQGIDRAWSEKGIGAIGSMLNLETLELSPSSLTKEQWQSLANLGSLKMIYLTDRDFSDDDLQYLPQWPHLEAIDLSRSMLTDNGLNRLVVFQKLNSLELASTGISDQGVSTLLQFHALETLNLSDTKITDTSIEYLAKMTHLKRVMLSDTKVTKGAIQKLKNARPDLIIESRF